VPEENAELVRRHFERFNAGDVDGLVELFAEDAVVETDHRFPEGGVFEGRAALRRLYEGFHEGWERGSVGEITRLTEAPGDVLLVDFIWRGTGDASRIETRNEISGLWSVRDGRITRVRYFLERDEALKAAGLEG
jgi:ketosteroid isomerase-like protein